MNSAKLKLLFIVPLLTAGTCAAQEVEHPVAREVIRTGKNPEYFRIPNKDVEMRDAVHSARKTVGKFIAALQKPSPTQHDFEVKVPIVQGKEVEHVWLSDVTYSGNRFHGTVDNNPVRVKGLKMGSRLWVKPSHISDWAYVDHKNLVGGYTIRVLYKELSPKRRKELEDESRFHIASQ